MELKSTITNFKKKKRKRNNHLKDITRDFS